VCIRVHVWANYFHVQEGGVPHRRTTPRTAYRDPCRHHNNHHAFEYSAAHGLEWWEVRVRAHGGEWWEVRVRVDAGKGVVQWGTAGESACSMMQEGLENVLAV
jgi:hypothetical protein